MSVTRCALRGLRDQEEPDIAVFDANGWPSGLADERLRERLVALNAERAEEEKHYLVRRLHPSTRTPPNSRPARKSLTAARLRK